jgi:2,4-dichlorophenol 6-monooxygenase
MDVPVLIVGGGGAGLTCSMLLAQLGIETFEAGSSPTDEALPRQSECLRRTTGAAEVSQSAER